jgi:Carboxypeptidase regulatory-like domain
VPDDKSTTAAAPPAATAPEVDRPRGEGDAAADATSDVASAPAGSAASAPASAPASDASNAPAGDPSNAPAGDPSNAPAGDPSSAPAGSAASDASNAPAGDAPSERPPAVGDADTAPPPRDEPSRRRRRVALVAAGAGVAIAVIAIVLAARRHPHALNDPGATPAGGAALRATPTPTLPGQVAGARLTGFVVDGAGLPVAGAEVSAELEHGAPDRALAPLPPTGPAAAGSAAPDAGVARDAAMGDAGTALAIAPLTAADGRFVVEGLVPGRFRVRVTGAGLLPAEVRYVPVPSDEARIVVARQVAIDGTVTDGGKPVANATVGLRGDAIGGTIELRTSAAGAFHFANLPEGRYQLFAWQAALAARTVRIARLGAGPFGPVELRLEAASIVVGRVIDRDEGTGLAAAVELRPSGDDQAPRYVRSGDDGVFRIEGVPSGRWIADAFVPGYLSPGGIELEAGRGVAEIALAGGGAISGRVLDGDGHPIAGAQVRALTAGTSAAEVSAEVDRDKLRRFSGRTAAPVPVSPAGVLDHDPEFVARGELGVMVGPIPPIPPPGAHVAQTAVAIDPSLAGEPAGLPGDPARGSIWTTGADGSYRIRGFARAKVTVLASASGFAEARGHQIAIEPGQVVAGVDLVLTPGTLILGKVSDQHGAPVIGAQVTATPVGANTHDAAGAPLDVFTDDTGAYKLGPVAGTVELHATAYGHGEAKRTIELAPVPGTTPAERHEDLVLAVADAMVAGILEDATGAAVSGAQLEVVGGVGDGRRAVAAADGTFALDLLPAGRLRLHIAHPAYPPDDVDVVAASGNPARTRLRLPLGGGVEGALLDAASGAPIASVTLAAAGPGNALADASTDRAGHWKLGPLTPGRWRIAVKQPGYLTQIRELDVPVAHVPGGTSVRDIRLELARGALLGGTVRDARGQRLAAAHVAIAGGGLSCEADTDGQGEFRIHDCPTGDLAVVATKAGLRGETRATVHPGDEVLGLALELR